MAACFGSTRPLRAVTPRSAALAPRVARSSGVTPSVAPSKWGYHVLLSETPKGKPPAIGQPYQGGIVAYILASGDPGYLAGETHGLIAAVVDAGRRIHWATEPYWEIPAVWDTSAALGTGSANTDAIIARNGAGTTYAAGLARAYAAGSYSDWYLPSKDELNKLYLNRVVIGGFDTITRWFPYYWSSSEYESGPYDAWFQSFDGGGQHANVKDTTYRVRAVRAF